MLSGLNVFWVEIPKVWQLSNQGEKQVEFRQVNADSIAFDSDATRLCQRRVKDKNCAFTEQTTQHITQAYKWNNHVLK